MTAPVSSGTILLVEDNDDDAALVKLAVKHTGLLNRLVVARDGGEALDYVFGVPATGIPSGGRPWLVLLDLKLRRVGGLETLATLRADERTQHLPVVIFTSSNEESDVVASYRLGANSYIRKPHDFEDLASLLEQIVRYWSVNELPPAAQEG
jgi:two-component system response regulator